jgi:hypothetical protein
VAVEDCNDDALPSLTARDVCQVLRDVTFGRYAMTKIESPSRGEVDTGRFSVGIEGWRVTFHRDGGQLDWCEACADPEGRRWSFDAGDRFGTDPLSLLSTWERGTLEQLLGCL